ncbi:hypothetical protein STRTUCAR8_07900, partial [Streptomyces turgidiscabies Car8]
MRGNEDRADRLQGTLRTWAGNAG